MAQQQKALFLSGVGGNWFLGEREIPKPGPGQLLVKIHSTALNPFDWKASKYSSFLTDFPVIMGTDSAGTVAAVGEGVSNFQVGDEVYVV
jgi:NADPH:quinone reductase-like Zn-dependent oxidoreductase